MRKRPKQNISFFSLFYLTQHMLKYRRPVGDMFETHRGLTCLVGDLSGTDMLDWRPLRDTYLASDRLRVQNCFIKKKLVQFIEGGYKKSQLSVLKTVRNEQGQFSLEKTVRIKSAQFIEGGYNQVSLVYRRRL